jgi:hypothetical protein
LILPATRAWERLWFSEIPPHSYALLRILIGLVGLCNLIGLGHLDTFWALDGLVPLDSGVWLKRLIESTGQGEAAPALLYLACLVAFALMTLGVRSNVSVVLALAASLLVVTWNNLPLSGADTLIRGILFCLIWADCGAVWSVDAWLNRRASGVKTEPEPAVIAPLRLIRFQLALLYLSTGLWKLANPLWRDGSALYYIANNNLFHRFPIETSPAWEPLLTIATYGTLVWEIGFAFALWFRFTRLVALGVGVVMHVAMIATIEIGPFSAVMLAAYVAFFDPAFVATLPNRLSRKFISRPKQSAIDRSSTFVAHPDVRR